MLIEEKIKSQIDQAKNILLVSHKNPDADSLGASCALLLYLKNKNKHISAFCIDEIPKNLTFLTGSEKFFHQLEELDILQYDLIICSDCGEKKQTGITDFLTMKKPSTVIINIDHHQTNDNFGDINLVKPQSSSTCEIIYELLQKLQITISKQMTDCLLAGILTDTTYFSNAATTIQAVNAASQLLRQGASIKQITKNIWRNKNLQTLKIWGKIFDRLIFNDQQKTATAIITADDLNNQDSSVLEGLANFLTNLYDAKIILVLYQKDNTTIKGSLRTTCDNINVATLAQELGGGGHQKAAGFSITGKLIFENNTWRIE